MSRKRRNLNKAHNRLLADFRCLPRSSRKTITWNQRFFLVLFGLAGLFSILIWRLVDLTIFKRSFLLNQGNARVVRVIPIVTHRGMIVDRNGEPLAISTLVDSIWVDPSTFKPNSNQLKILAKRLGFSLDRLDNLIKDHSDKEFIYLKRIVNPELADQVKALNIPGLFLEKRYHRYYPDGAVTAHILGFTNVDDQGQEGLELAYNDWLQGTPGAQRVVRDRLGRVIMNLDKIREPSPGHDLQLSIDHKLQYVAYRELKAGISRYAARSGSVVIVNPKTGEILAMINWPSYNPNKRHHRVDSYYRNRAVTDVFEPGSTMKTFSMASVLASKRFSPTTVVDTAPGWMMVSDKKISDHRNHGLLNLREILQVSSNVGMSKLILSLPPHNLLDLLNQLGFGRSTNSGLPGERSGYLPYFKVWNPFVLATLSFGYGISVTALQLTRAYCVLANQGRDVSVTILNRKQAEPGVKIINQETSRTLLSMLESVLQSGGTAPLARIPGYRVTGKSGTVRILGSKGYEKKHHNSIFVGIAPAQDPALVVSVILQDPAGQYYGGYAAGSVFSKIMNYALHYLNKVPSIDENLAN